MEDWFVLFQGNLHFCRQVMHEFMLLPFFIFARFVYFCLCCVSEASERCLFLSIVQHSQAAALEQNCPHSSEVLFQNEAPVRRKHPLRSLPAGSSGCF